MEKYEKLEKVDEGTYGKVYKTKDKTTGLLLALKKTCLKMDEYGIPPTVLREISLLQMPSHSLYIIRLLCVEHINKKWQANSLTYFLSIWILILRNTSILIGKDPMLGLFFQPSSRGRVSCTNCAKGLLTDIAMEFCTDLKPQNILMNKEKGILKISDLGLGRAFTIPMKSYTHEIVTPWYRAPEVFLGSTRYSIAIDMWSVGCILVPHMGICFPCPHTVFVSKAFSLAE